MSFAEKLREDRRLVILRLLSESRGYTLNSSNLHAGLDFLHIQCTRADVLADLRFLANNGLVDMTSIENIPNLYGVKLTHDGMEVVSGLQIVVGVSKPWPK